MDEPKDRLIKARAAAGYDSPTAAAKAIRSLNKNTLTSNENGNRAISRKAAELYAKAFGTTAGWLLFGEHPVIEVEDVKIPLVSMVSAGRMRDQAGVFQTDIEKYVHLNDLPTGDWIALTVEGDSMNRLAPDGSVVIVNRADDVLIDGKFYIFSLDGSQATFKTFRRGPDRLQPFSTNPDFMSTPVSEDLYVFGRVRRIIQEV